MNTTGEQLPQTMIVAVEAHVSKAINMISNVRDCLILDEEFSPDLADEVVAVIDPFSNLLELYDVRPSHEDVIAKSVASSIARLFDFAAQKNLTRRTTLNLIKAYFK